MIALLATASFIMYVAAQSQIELNIQTYAGLTVAGEVGTVYSIEYTTDIERGNWQCLELLQLLEDSHLWIDKSAPITAKRFYRAVQMDAPESMVWIPPGTFRMGSPTNEVNRMESEGPQTAVVISRGFWMGKYEVTQGEYQSVMGQNPSWFNGDRTGESEWPGDYGIDLNRPVEVVSWDDAVLYCELLTQREVLASRIPPGCAYRLPTHAEWEYACRAWTSTRFSYGDDPDYSLLADYAWYRENSASMTHPVGQKLPNSWGLYDMHGNVSEWCLDAGLAYPGGTVLDPFGSNGRDGVASIRGGHWLFGAAYSRSAARSGDDRIFGYAQLGFRIILAPVQP